MRYWLLRRRLCRQSVERHPEVPTEKYSILTEQRFFPMEIFSSSRGPFMLCGNFNARNRPEFLTFFLTSSLEGGRKKIRMVNTDIFLWACFWLRPSIYSVMEFHFIAAAFYGQDSNMNEHRAFKMIAGNRKGNWTWNEKFVAGNFILWLTISLPSQASYSGARRKVNMNREVGSGIFSDSTAFLATAVSCASSSLHSASKGFAYKKKSALCHAGHFADYHCNFFCFCSPELCQLGGSGKMFTPKEWLKVFVLR